MSVFFMATTDEATMELGSSPGLPRTMMRSPACRSARCNGAASFKSLEPGGTRISLASAETTTFISAPASVVKVRVLPEMVLMVPRAGGDLGAGAAGVPCPARTEKGEPPSRQKLSTTLHKRRLFGRILLTTTVPIELSSSSPTVVGARSEIAGTLPTLSWSEAHPFRRSEGEDALHPSYTTSTGAGAKRATLDRWEELRIPVQTKSGTHNGRATQRRRPGLYLRMAWKAQSRLRPIGDYT